MTKLNNCYNCKYRKKNFKIATEAQIDRARVILDAIEIEILEIGNLVPDNNIEIIGFQLICQYKNKLEPDRIYTINVEHGQPVSISADKTSYMD